ncbi:MAG: hypothetical protein ACREKE_07110 [bacterium]
MRRLAVLAPLLLALAVSASASQNVYQSAVSAGRWLNLPFSTQAAGLAGLGATGQGVDALSYNPAGLAGVQEYQADLGQDYWLTDASSQRLGLALPLGPGGLGVAFDNVDFGGVDQYSVNGLGQVTALGSVNPDAWALQVGYGLSLGDFSVGASLQGLNQNLVSQQQIGYDLDLGAGYREGRLRLGLGLLGAAGELGGESLPRDLGLEGRFRAWSRGQTDLDVLAGSDWSVSDEQATAALALEARVNRYLTVRGGYRVAGGDAAGGWAFGLSVKPLSWLGVDYAYNAVGSLQATNQWALDVSWGALGKAAKSGSASSPTSVERKPVLPVTPAVSAPVPSPVPVPSSATVAAPSPIVVAPVSPPLPWTELPVRKQFRRRLVLPIGFVRTKVQTCAPGLSTGLDGPMGVATDGAGDLMIADEYSQRVLEVSPSGAVRRVAGTGFVGFARDGSVARSSPLAYPSGVAVGGDGDIFIADTGNHRVLRVGASGVLSVVAGTGAAHKSGDGGPIGSAEFLEPIGLALDGHGDLFIADIAADRVREVKPSGLIMTVAGDGTAGYSGDGGAATAAELDAPAGLAVDARGNLYIADSGNQRVREVGTDGVIRTAVGDGRRGWSGDGGSALSARLNRPYGVALDAEGDLYIADSGNQRVREVDASGVIRTVAGDGSVGYFGDGPNSVRLSFPSAVAVGPSGRVYVADYGNHLVRVVK